MVSSGHLFEADAPEALGIVQPCTPCCLALFPRPGIQDDIHMFLQKSM